MAGHEADTVVCLVSHFTQVFIPKTQGGGNTPIEIVNFFIKYGYVADFQRKGRKKI